ncbi:MAG TPA: hypothetical protein VMU27_01385, partial [Candidatus Paceibacterota bacterium]|nr:hypothetical protein [Candidatus Paceibacterota bacterium]
WGPAQVWPYRSPRQQSEHLPCWPIGHELLQELKAEARHPYNACLLDFLLKHPRLIPEEWRSVCMFFFGTIYSDWNYIKNVPHVLYLYWRNGSWHWGARSLDQRWDSPRYLAAVSSK